MLSGKIVVLGGRHAGESFALCETPVMIGSAEECEIRLMDQGVLPNHACIDCTPEGEWLLARTGDDAEIEVKGESVAEIELTSGVVFRLGGVAIRFEMAEAPVPLPETSLPVVPICG